MKESDYYPAGAWNDPDAPYNWHEQPEIELEITVSLTISKTVKVWVNDYETSIEEDPDDNTVHTYYDFSNCNLEEYVQEQIELPHELAKDLENNHLTEREKRSKIQDCKDWTVDDVCCVLEDYNV
jgi:hypothetical protein